jgi:adenosylcobinamide amidohydrolase
VIADRSTDPRPDDGIDRRDGRGIDRGTDGGIDRLAGDTALLVDRFEADRVWPALVWTPGPGYRMLSTGVDGGGLGERHWWLNTQVGREYFEPDPVAHVRRIAAGLGLRGPGVGMLTAADVRHYDTATEDGSWAVATVGLGLPVPAAASVEQIAAETAPRGPGTINVLVVVPVPLEDSALVNLVITATEAKTQALAEAGVPGTGTSSDALCIACPITDRSAGAGLAPEPYGGPRSAWGARAARAVHTAVARGTAGWLRRHPDGDPHRRWPVPPHEAPPAPGTS